MRSFLMAMAAGAALLAACPASAASITYQSWFAPNNGPTPTDFPKTYTLTDFNGLAQKIFVQQFDSALGTLTGATLKFYADINSVGQLTNKSATSSSTITSYVASLQTRLLQPSNDTSGPGITTPAVIGTPALLQELPTLLSVSDTTLAPGAAIGFNVTGASDTSSMNLFTSAFLPYFQGTGTVALPVFTRTRTVANVTGGNLALTQTTEARVEAIVTYKYTAAPPVGVPEPVTLALLGTSLLGLGLARCRRG